MPPPTPIQHQTLPAGITPPLVLSHQPNESHNCGVNACRSRRTSIACRRAMTESSVIAWQRLSCPLSCAANKDTAYKMGHKAAHKAMLAASLMLHSGWMTMMIPSSLLLLSLLSITAPPSDCRCNQDRLAKRLPLPWPLSLPPCHRRHLCHCRPTNATIKTQPRHCHSTPTVNLTTHLCHPDHALARPPLPRQLSLPAAAAAATAPRTPQHARLLQAMVLAGSISQLKWRDSLKSLLQE